jgi:hypothetical protein
MTAFIFVLLAGAALASSGAPIGSGSSVGRAYVIAGQVLDADSAKPMANVNVVLCLAAESTQITGCATDGDGVFRIEIRETNHYSLVASAVGFRPERVPVALAAPDTSIDVGRILLKRQVLPVRGVDVTAQAPAVTYEADRRVIDVSKLPIRGAATAVDVLEHVPSVKVEPDGTVLLRGEGFTLLIDGRPSPLDPSQALKQMPSSSIDKIEIITNPTAKYNPEGTNGIINIIMKKRRARGLSALGTMSLDTRLRASGSVLLGLRSRIADIFAGGGFTRGEFRSDDEWENRTFGPAETLVISSAGSRSSRQQSGSVQAGMELRPGPRDKVSLVGRYGALASRSDRTAWQTELHLPGDGDRQYSTIRTSRSAGEVYFVMADHVHSFDTTGHQLCAHADITGRNDESRSEYDELDSTGALTDGRISDEGGPSSNLNLSLEYTLPLREGSRLDAGIQNRNQQRAQNPRVSWYNPDADSFELDHVASHANRMTEHTYAAYATCSWDWGKLKLGPGLRGEVYQRTLDVTDSSAMYLAERADLFPSMNVSYGERGKLQAGASYSRRTQRPSAGSLLPFLVWRDRHNVGQGDTALKPEHTDSWEATCNMPFGTSSVNAEVYYRVTNDLIWGLTSLYQPDSSVLLSKSANIGSDRSLGAELAVDVSPFRWLNLNLRGDLHDSRVYGVPLAGEGEDGGPAWNASASASLQLPSAYWIVVSGGYSSPSVTFQSWMGGRFNMNVAVRKTLLNRALSINLRAWAFPNSESGTEGRDFYSRVIRRSDPLGVSLSLSYNFNNLRLGEKLRQGEGIEAEGFESQ